MFLRHIVQDFQQSGELPHQDKKYSIYGKSTVGNFKFIELHKTVPKTTDLTSMDEFVLRTKYLIRHLAGSRTKWYGLDNSAMLVENVPLIITPHGDKRRIDRAK